MGQIEPLKIADATAENCLTKSILKYTILENYSSQFNNFWVSRRGEMWDWMIRNMFCEGASWFWSMAQFFAIAISLVLIYRQVRLQRQANMLQTLGSLDNRWNSQDMLASRKKACENYLTDKLRISREQSDVLAFFEDIGVYLQRGVFDTESVWDKYSYYIEHYWAMYQPHIIEFRAESKDSTWYEKFEVLKNRMEEFSKKKGLKAVGKSQEELKKFISVEKG